MSVSGLVAVAMPWLLKAAGQEPVLSYMPGCPNIGVVESWAMLGDMYRCGLPAGCVQVVFDTCAVGVHVAVNVLLTCTTAGLLFTWLLPSCDLLCSISAAGTTPQSCSCGCC